MKPNSAMKILLEQYKLDDVHLISQDRSYPIWEKEDTIGRKYWGVANFCGLDRMLHEKSEDILRGLYKSASFVVQAIAFKQTGCYIRRQKELLQVVSSSERGIVETFMNLKKVRQLISISCPKYCLCDQRTGFTIVRHISHPAFPPMS